MGALHSKLRRKPKTSPRLPVELLVVIEEFLVGDNSFRTAANLNIACRLVYQETALVLHATTVLKYELLLSALSSGQNRWEDRWSRTYVKLMILEDVPAPTSTRVDSLALEQAFPNMKAFFCGVKPFSMFTSGAYFHGDYYREGTTLTVFKPVSCAAVVDVIQSLAVHPLQPAEPRRLRITRRKATHRPRKALCLRVSELRLKNEGCLIEGPTDGQMSKIRSVVDCLSFKVNLGDAPVDNLTDDRAEALESYLKMGDAQPNEEPWRMCAWRLYMLFHVSMAPGYMTALGRAYSGLRHYGDHVTIQLDDPSSAPWVELLEQWVNQYLIARRVFHANLADADIARLMGLLERNSVFDWHDPVGTRNRVQELQH